MHKVREILIYSDGRLVCGDKVFRCALGKGGVTDHKLEGDGATPLGTFPIRKVLYRKDRMPEVDTDLTLEEITQDMGWSDDVLDEDYNTQIFLPHIGRHENLWREDHIYNVVCVLGYNDDPVGVGKGSAIFMHLSRENYTPTEGCVALSEEDMLVVLRDLSSGAHITILRA